MSNNALFASFAVFAVIAAGICGMAIISEESEAEVSISQGTFPDSEYPVNSASTYYILELHPAISASYQSLSKIILGR
ncbi:hypothetical protein, partial [Candidatus Methanoprimaticola sp. MG2]|uniref:hypothetical protein n=1 Tax=Candidatus Methanoprimaticola sp. MG2 TaxID=3228838 RepID=UPI0039C5E976